MMTHPASVFVIAFTAINVLACLWLMWWTARARPTPEAQASGGKTGHVWDGDLEEYNNPMPRWWLGLFVITVLFGAGYLIVFPGLGNFAGSNRWSSVGAYEAQMKVQRARFEARVASLQGLTLQQLAADPGAMATARNLFGANCSNCHGSDARGTRGFPNLTDPDWLWGGEERAVYDSIAQGREGVMPALGAALGDTGVNEVASYVISLGGQKAPDDWVAAGKDRFAVMCAACHGGDAKGNPLLGAPNLTDGAWLHGGDFDSVRATITNGRNSQMPAHAATLGESKVRLLAAYVLSLSAESKDGLTAATVATDDGSQGSAPDAGAQ
jgi:cytochrome c oxidase cbb3-type subunit III